MERRSFLRMLCLAPVAVPLVAASASKPERVIFCPSAQVNLRDVHDAKYPQIKPVIMDRDAYGKFVGHLNQMMVANG